MMLPILFFHTILSSQMSLILYLAAFSVSLEVAYSFTCNSGVHVTMSPISRRRHRLTVTKKLESSTHLGEAIISPSQIWICRPRLELAQKIKKAFGDTEPQCIQAAESRVWTARPRHLLADCRRAVKERFLNAPALPIFIPRPPGCACNPFLSLSQKR